MAKEGKQSSSAPFGGGFYFLAMIGAWVWFWQQQDGFWGHVLAILEGLVWPAFLTYDLFQTLN
jgi:hypothetical protein